MQVCLHFKDEETEGQRKTRHSQEVLQQEFGSNFVLAVAGPLSVLYPFTSCSSREEIGTAIRTITAGRLISSCLSHCCQMPKPQHGLVACPLPPLRGATSHAGAWLGWHPPSLCQPRHQTGRVWEEELQPTALPFRSSSVSIE